ncbi:hypothetical protein [Mesorhizobium sp. LjNodule214]|uniref:hypothetical protein n=1 Tax=Mesorhizobium sp. LjNodule214 TaxID=3342252 RepID=UPI003ECEFB11
MGNKLRPGNLSPKNQHWVNDPLFANSMAEVIEDELNTLMTNDGLPELDTDASDSTVRDRRRLFIAIARGVVRHLQQNKSAIKVFCEDNETKPVTAINVDYG